MFRPRQAGLSTMPTPDLTLQKAAAFQTLVHMHLRCSTVEWTTMGAQLKPYIVFGSTHFDGFRRISADFGGAKQRATTANERRNLAPSSFKSNFQCLETGGNNSLRLLGRDHPRDVAEHGAAEK